MGAAVATDRPKKAAKSTGESRKSPASLTKCLLRDLLAELSASVGGAEPPRWLASGIFRDRLRKCPVGWCFKSRRFDADGAAVAALCMERSLPAVADRLR